MVRLCMKLTWKINSCRKNNPCIQALDGCHCRKESIYTSGCDVDSYFFKYQMSSDIRNDNKFEENMFLQLLYVIWILAHKTLKHEYRSHISMHISVKSYTPYLKKNADKSKINTASIHLTEILLIAYIMHLHGEIHTNYSCFVGFAIWVDNPCWYYYTYRPRKKNYQRNIPPLWT